MIRRFAFVALLWWSGVGLFGQSPFASHIEILADDKLEGRETGTNGEMMAMEYIVAEFQAAGLSAIDGNWTQEFEFLNRRSPAEDCRVTIGKLQPAIGTDCMIFPHSGNGTFEKEIVSVGYGIAAADLGHDDYADMQDLGGKFAVIIRGTPDGNNPHSKFSEHSPLTTKIEVAVKRGAGGIIFVNPDAEEMEDPKLNFTRNISREEIPILWLRDSKAADIAGQVVKGKVALTDDKRTGRNVIGKLDHGAAHTIVLGAHYDHLGYGENGSLHRGERAIHNGADDNASGVALIIEAAKELKKDAYNKFNYVFIAFSGEEKGLLGSNFYCKNPTIDLEKVNCMLNFDMVGRLDPTKNTLGINGAGTSPAWKDLLSAIQIDDMKVKTTESGVGPSDHTSFYLKDVPVLHFFSGTHSDYHKPSDDLHLINYDGMDKIYRYVIDLVGRLNGMDKLAFSKTKSERAETPRWKVSLGVVPDYMFDGQGMRIDGISEGRPAEKAGLKAGDIVIKMDAHEVKDMMSYMRALSKFDKGDKITVTVLRDGKAKKKKVVF